MEIKVYNKRGKRNYRENRLINELKAELEQRLKKDDSLVFNFKPAESFEELQSLHREYTSVDVEYVEEKNEDVNMPRKENVEIADDFSKEDNSYIDPFNRQEPTTYDYTNEGGFSKDSTPKNTGQTDFAEPMSFSEAFELPDENDEAVENDKPSSNSKEDKQQKTTTKQQTKKEDPWNPSFDDMSGGNQKKSTKKFAKYIVEAVCALAEKGFTWYANKDITEPKLAEYELSGEMDLSILVTLENGQEATVKRFFQQQCIAAEQLSKFEEEEKKDISEALAVVFLEKGIAPSPTQELLIIVGGVLFKKGAMLLSLKSSTNSLLEQLRAMNTQQPQNSEEPQPQYQEPQQPVNQVYSEVNGVPNVSFEESGLVSDEDMLNIEKVLETKE
jgi:hypothetical protein